MRVTQLAVFWRDEQARCFTAWHFQPAQGERDIVRAGKILTVLTQFSALQLYGAALDDQPLPIEQVRPAPAHGTAYRLQADLYPNAEVNPKIGINFIKFSLPGPITEIIDLVESK